MSFGVLLFFDGGLLALGNILLLIGIAFVMGYQKLLRFVGKRNKGGLAAFLLGVALIFLGFSKIGIVVEAFGFVNLFGYP